MHSPLGTLWFDPLSLDKLASFGISTSKQMLIEAKERKWLIQDGGSLGGLFGNFVVPPLILDGYMLNDI